MARADYLQHLASVPIFAQCNKQQLQEIGKVADELTVPAGTVLTRQGEAALELFVIIDGTLIAIDRVAKDRPFYSGKHRRHGMNLQVISSPDGTILWVSGPLPGSVHYLTAARIWGTIRETGRRRADSCSRRQNRSGGAS